MFFPISIFKKILLALQISNDNDRVVSLISKVTSMSGYVVKTLQVLHGLMSGLPVLRNSYA